MPWTEAEDQILMDLAKKNELFFVEIAERLGKKVQVVRWRAKKLGVVSKPEGRMGLWNQKHAHLRPLVLQYFQTHTLEETASKFGLTVSELRSCLSYAYKEGAHRDLRKDKRTHNPWTSEELIFLLRHAGLQQREWIAEKIQRGNARVIKEKLMSLGVNTKTLNGMTLSKYRSAFGQEPRRAIQTSAGPGRGGTPTYFKIVPWVDVLEELNVGRVRAPKLFADVASAMSAFQHWIHGEDPIASLRLAASAGHEPPVVNRTYKHVSKEVLT